MNPMMNNWPSMCIHNNSVKKNTVKGHLSHTKSKHKNWQIQNKKKRKLRNRTYSSSILSDVWISECQNFDETIIAQLIYRKITFKQNYPLKS